MFIVPFESPANSLISSPSFQAKALTHNPLESMSWDLRFKCSVRVCTQM